jgi:hypothetical protein
MTTIIPGNTTFHSIIADSNALWRVVAPRGANTWDCVVDAANPDYAGSKKVFGGEEIIRAVNQGKMWDELRTSNRDFWQSREIGEILHYEDFNNRWVRAVVVQGVDKDGKEAKVLLPTALVGKWAKFDLPMWTDAGIYREGSYHVGKIAAGETFQPNESCIWEYKQGTGQRISGDPRGMEEIDLSAPSPTDEQRAASILLKQIEAIRNTVSSSVAGVTDYPAYYQAQLQKVVDLVAHFDLEPSNAELTPGR